MRHIIAGMAVGLGTLAAGLGAALLIVNGL